MSETQNTQEQRAPQQTVNQQPQSRTKFCKHCGQVIDERAVICPKCGCQVEEIKNQQNVAQPNIVINNSNVNSNVNTNINGTQSAKPKNKWVALLLCFFLGALGAHKFYEGKVGMGVLYLFTVGLCGIGVIVDFVKLLFKPNPYYV